MSYCSKLRLENRLLVSLTLLGMVPLLITLVVSLTGVSSSLEEGTKSGLEELRAVKKAVVEEYFEDIRKQVVTQAESTMTVEALSQFRVAFPEYGTQAGLSESETSTLKAEVALYYRNEFLSEYERQCDSKVPVEYQYSNLPRETLVLQKAYISSNPHPLGSKESLDRASDDTSYNLVHERFHPIFRSFLQNFGYYDIFLVDAETGNIVYSVFKELDFGTSLKNGPYSGSHFGEAFKEALKVGKGEVVLKDFANYRPSYDAPASFIASPIYKDDAVLGVLIFQMPIGRLNQMIAKGVDPDSTTDIYFLGEDGRFRSDSLISPEHNVVDSFRSRDIGLVRTEGSEAGLAGETGVQVGLNYLGDKVVSAYSPVELPGGLRWTLLWETGLS